MIACLVVLLIFALLAGGALYAWRDFGLFIDAEAPDGC